VIGRTIETAFLAALAKIATERGGRTLAGWFYPTAKNAPARDVYRLHGFVAAGETDGGTRWDLALPAKNLTCPEWIYCQISTNEGATS
jgi:predicted enzyme involved in methoxymalonyl-ACP biosynthesis